MLSAYPDFFEQAPSITLYDPLAQFLGASRDGLITYDYKSVVALAGHSCPTVACAYLMTINALKALYGADTPVRGNLAIEWSGSRDEGVVGVMASVVSYITGAADEAGFKGIAGNFQRSERLRFNSPIDSEVRFTRLDTGKKASVSSDLSRVPMDPQVRELMPLCLSGRASEADLQRFGAAWQKRVEALLLKYADDPEVIQVSLS